MSMVSAVVLAAGESKRMGEKKEILPIAGKHMIRVIVEKLLRSRKLDEVIVVLGDRADDVGRALAGLTDERLELVGNRRFREGMGTSLAHGARACSWHTDAILVALGDAPFFAVENVDALIDAHAAGAAIAVPLCEGRRGHPVVFDGAYRSELEELSGDAGARHIVERETASVVDVEIEDDAFLVDVDEREDYEAVKEGLPREA
jgi:molybdenum cofactor cytidylyltransferase